MYSQNSWSHFVTSNVIPNTPIQVNVFQALFPPPPKIQKAKETRQWTLAVFRVVNKDLMAKLRHKRKPIGCQWRFNSPRNTDAEWSGTGSRKSKLTWHKVWQVMWRARKTPLVDRFIRSKTNIRENVVWLLNDTEGYLMKFKEKAKEGNTFFTLIFTVKWSSGVPDHWGCWENLEQRRLFINIVQTSRKDQRSDMYICSMSTSFFVTLTGVLDFDMSWTA